MNSVTTNSKSFSQKYSDIMPQGAGALFLIQIFATLAFSVLYSTLVLYTTDSLHLSDTVATSITASFVAFNYALHLLGGYIGGRFLSYRSLFGLGMLLQMIGCLLISIPTTTALYWGLAAFLTGAGLNLTCINCMLMQLFKPNDKRREAAFLWNYSGMNVGFFVGFSVSGYFQLHNNYHALFLFAAIGNLITLVLMCFKWNMLSDTNTYFIRLPKSEKLNANMKGFLVILALVALLRFIIVNAHISNNLVMLAGAFMACVIAYLAMTQPTAAERNKIWAYLILALTALVFWTLYQLAPMGMTLFIERNVNRNYFGILMAPQWVQNINTIVIIIGGPILSVLFNSIRNRGAQLTIPVQFGIGLLLIGVALMVLPIGIYFADAEGLVNFNWIILSYVLQSIGELCISPIGFAMVGQLAPAHLQGLLMGTWLMIIGVAATLSSYFSNMALGTSASTNPLVTNPSFSHAFSLLGSASIVTGIGLLIFIPWVIRLMQEKKVYEQQVVSPATV